MLSFVQVLIPLLIVIITIFISSSLLGERLGSHETIMFTAQVFGKTFTVHSPFIYGKIGSTLINSDREYQELIFQTMYPAIIGVISAALIQYLLAVLRGKNTIDGIHGDARWATWDDLLGLGFIAENGIILGQKNTARIFKRFGKWVQGKISELIIDGDDTSTLCVAPSRSGKGISNIIPTLFSWRGSVIVFDPKGENWNVTAGFRKIFSHTVRFDPTKDFSIGINPLDEVDRGPNGYRDASSIAQIFFTKDGKGGGENDHFTDTAKELLTGVILHVTTCLDFHDDDRNFQTVLDVLSGSNLIGMEEDDEIHEVICLTMMKSKHLNETVHKQVHGIALTAKSKPDRERGSVFSTALRVLSVFRDPILAANMSKSDIKFSDFMDAKNPISLYLTVPYPDIDRLSPILRLLISFMVFKFSAGETSHDKQALKHKCLFIIDEFPSLGAFPFLEKTMAILAGYGLKFLIVVQSINQIVKLYGQENAFMSNCKKWIIFAPGELGIAKELSDIAGSYSKWVEGVSSSGSKYDVGLKQMSRSGSEQQVKLIQPDQLMRMKSGDCLLYAHGMHPYPMKMVLFFKDKRFKRLAKIPGPQTIEELRAELHGLPREIQNTVNNDGIEIATNNHDSFFEGIESGGGVPPKIEEDIYEGAAAPSNTPELIGSEFAMETVEAAQHQQQNHPDTAPEPSGNNATKKAWWGAI